jgi:predicted DNA-binding protein (MmcQ/YjbR family)
MTKSSGTSNPAYEHLRAAALRYPEAVEEFPWGHSAIKVRGKAFVFMGADGGKFGLSCKLPASHEAAMLLPFATPTGYGLGKSGWVSANFDEGDRKVPLGLLEEWIGESYRAVAPKKLAAALGGDEVVRAGASGRSAGTGAKKAGKAGPAKAGAKKAAKAGDSGRSARTEAKKTAKAVAAKAGAKKAAPAEAKTAAKAGDSGRSEGAGAKTGPKKAAKAAPAEKAAKAAPAKKAAKAGPAKAAKVGPAKKAAQAAAKKPAKAGAAGRSAGTGARRAGQRA